MFIAQFVTFFNFDARVIITKVAGLYSHIKGVSQSDDYVLGLFNMYLLMNYLLHTYAGRTIRATLRHICSTTDKYFSKLCLARCEGTF